MRTFAIFATFGLLAALAPRDAAAVAHHEQTVVQKLRDPVTKKVIGARVHLIADPENYDHVRVLVGQIKMFPNDARDAKAHTPDADHRQIAAGNKPGYVRMILGEVQGLKARANQANFFELQELKLDLIYGKGNDIKAGDKVDIYSTYNNAKTNATYWHVFGMHDGPVNVKDAAHVFELPTETSTHPEATEIP